MTQDLDDFEIIMGYPLNYIYQISNIMGYPQDLNLYIYIYAIIIPFLSEGPLKYGIFASTRVEPQVEPRPLTPRVARRTAQR